jgi:hypothetical protein
MPDWQYLDAGNIVIINSHHKATHLFWVGDGSSMLGFWCYQGVFEIAAGVAFRQAAGNGEAKNLARYLFRAVGSINGSPAFDSA